MRYFLRFVLLFCFIQKAFSGLDAGYFHGLDEALIKKGVPSHLLPSGRDIQNQKVYNSKVFGRKDTIPHEDVPSYPGTHPYPQTYMTSLLHHLFPRDEMFLLANQIEVDPISKLAPDVLGKLVKATEIKDPELRFKAIAEILDLNLEAPSIKDVDLRMFNRQDRVQGYRRTLEVTVAEEDYSEIWHFNPAQPLTSYVRHKNPRILDKGYLSAGELEAATELPYKNNAVRLLRKKRFAEVLTKAAEENKEGSQEALAAFFWRRVISLEEMKIFYQGYVGSPLDLACDPFSLADFDRLTAQVTANPVNYFALSSEEKLLLVSQTKLLGFFPVGYATAKFREFPFPDCVEMALRNVVLHACFRLQEGRPIFDTMLLPEGPAKAYVASHPRWEDILSSQGRNDWAEVVSNKTDQGLSYYKTKKGVSYELRSGLENIVNALRYLLGVPFDREKKVLDMKKAGEELDLISKVLSSKKSVFLKLEGGSKIDLQSTNIDLFFNGTERDSRVGNINVLKNHAYYETASLDEAPWIKKVFGAVSSPEQALMVAPLIKRVPNGFGYRIDSDSWGIYSGPNKPEWVEDVDFLSPIFPFVTKASSAEKLRFYKNINMKCFFIRNFLVWFISRHDLANFPYLLDIARGIDRERWEVETLCQEIFPFITSGRISQTQTMQLTEAFPEIYSFENCARDSLFSWVVQNGQDWLLQSIQERVATLNMGILKTEEQREKAFTYLMKFPYVISLVYKVGNQTREMRKFFDHLPKKLRKLTVDVCGSWGYERGVKLTEYFTDFIKTSLKKNPEITIESQWSLEEKIVREILADLIRNDLPHRKFKVLVDGGEDYSSPEARNGWGERSVKLTEEIYAEFDRRVKETSIAS